MSKPEKEGSDGKRSSHRASIHCSTAELDDEFVAAITALQQSLDMPVWMLIQNSSTTEWGHISQAVYSGFLEQIDDMEQGKKVALLIDSPGGDARFAYKLARLLRVRCKEYLVVVPSYAKSAATLLALGASKIILGPYGELGPLDMQVDDPEREEGGSALNHVQALERLSAFALRTVDQTMLLMLQRTSKKVSNILPQAMDFASSIVRPLLENLDVVKYTEMSRVLKVGEAYAERLLRKEYGKNASTIASKLVNEYPEHGFVIEHTEAKAIGLDVEFPGADVADAIAGIMPFVNEVTAIGRLETISSE